MQQTNKGVARRSKAVTCKKKKVNTLLLKASRDELKDEEIKTIKPAFVQVFVLFFFFRQIRNYKIQTIKPAFVQSFFFSRHVLLCQVVLVTPKRVGVCVCVCARVRACVAVFGEARRFRKDSILRNQWKDCILRSQWKESFLLRGSKEKNIFLSKNK